MKHPAKCTINRTGRNVGRMFPFCSIILIILLVMPITAFAHPGRTDANGGHWDRKAGTYHYHNSGYNYTPPVYQPRDTTQSSSVNQRKTINLYKGDSYAGSANKNSLVYVSGYYRKDGTYVRPHHRTHPDNYKQNNFSYNRVSTLLPLDKYPNFTFTKNELQENYLLYNTITLNKTLNGDQLSKLSNYAKELSSKSNKKLLGESFYISIGLDSYTAKMMSAYDNNGVITSQTYLFFVLYDYLQSYGRDFNDIDKSEKELIPYYCAVLDLYQSGDIKESAAFKFGEWFYSLILNDLSIDDQDDQIEMDLMQDFSKIVNSKEYKEISSGKIDRDTLYDYKIENILEIESSYFYETDFNDDKEDESDFSMNDFIENKFKN